MLVTPKNGETAEDRRDRGFGPCFRNVQDPTWKMDDSGPWNHILKPIGTGCIVPAARRPGGQKECEDDVSYWWKMSFFIWLHIIMVEYEAWTYNWTYFSWANSFRFSVWNVSLDPSPSRKRLVLPDSVASAVWCLWVERKRRLSGWWLNQPSWKILVKMGIFPK